MPIALLKFPTDLLGEVFKECNPFELYTLSLCSQRIRLILKSRKLRCWKVSCHRSYFVRTIDVMCRDVVYEFRKVRSPEDCYKIDDRGMQIEFRNGEIMDSLDYMLNLFECSTMEFIRPTTYNDLLKFSRIAIDKKLAIEEFYMDKWNNDQEFSDSLALINQLNITKQLDLDHRVSSQGVQYRLTRFPNKLQIFNSSWFSIEQLMTCTSADIYLRGSYLTNQDLDRFLQKWKRGELPNLRDMHGKSIKLDSESPILGMYPPIRGQTKTTIKRISVDDTWDFRCVKIRNDQGREGLLEIDLRPPHFSFAVIGPTDIVVEGIDESSDDSDF
ncbi:hypothetical protein B9Z55_003703 [Caenorhabditis nigoni]|uniref:F-box domain-containing protein n=1 Tax=Caenorhabditis nigoni TaxID=1611254 RepID=A0A2G5VRQ5_9PELO|nr:hypothetical protein B9Z55_003703 [Caenorhabditis nigoni]